MNQVLMIFSVIEYRQNYSYYNIQMFDSFDFSQTLFSLQTFYIRTYYMCILNVKTKSQNMTVKNKEFVFENYYERILKKIAIIC